MQVENILRIAICDDEPENCRQIADMTEKILQSEGISLSIREYHSAKALLDAIREDTQYDILLLDVIMDDMTGMELASRLRQEGNKNHIIFISYNKDMAMYGYEVSAARFLSKPVDETKLKEALLYCLRSGQEKKEILLPTNQGTYRTSFSDIQFVEAYDRGTRFVLQNETVISRFKFAEVEKILPKSTFIHCHRAYIVNVTHIKRIWPYEFELKSGVHVLISKHRYYEVNKKFMNYIMN